MLRNPFIPVIFLLNQPTCIPKEMGLFDFLKKRELAEIQRLKDVISQQEKQIASLQQYQSIVDADNLIAQKLQACDEEIQEQKAKFAQEKSMLQHEMVDLQHKIEELSQQYKEGFEIYNRLKKETDIYRETLDMAEYGVYQPHFDFNASDKYKNEITRIREKQKNEIRSGFAVLGGENITWNGSASQGAAMVKKEKRLMLRAFNGECDSFIADVDWNNILRMEERIQKSFEAINKIYEKQDIHIASSYKNLKIAELRLAYEYKLKKHDEKEEQRAIREQMREEEKARREIESALIKAQKEEEVYQKALDKARKEILSVEGDKQIKLQQRITELEARVAEAEANKERALSMAQQTKRGHVYVISNIGSFGENIYKIGMTRRLDPMDRVRELGDASVPFPFDVHAIIFSEDAPALETKLHKIFDAKRINLLNPRKEFYKVTLEEIESVVHENDATIEFTKLAEARDYRESEALRANTQKTPETTEKFSRELFPS